MVTFFERLLAYLVDIVIIFIILVIVGYGLPSTNSDEFDEQMVQLEKQFSNGEITTKEYFKESYGLIYEEQNESKLSSFISLAVTIAYFVIFQTLYKGQTFGKKLFKLRIVDIDSHESVGILKMVLRSLFTQSIVSGSCSLLMLLLVSKNIYIIGYLIISGIELIFIITVIIMILYRKDKRGLHDLIAKTCVIKEGGM